MPHYLKLVNEVPEQYSFDALRSDNPNTSFPEVPSSELLAEYLVYEYTRQTAPSFDWMVEKLGDGEFILGADSVWELPYIIEQLPLEQASANVRGMRSGFLEESDWTQLSDAPVDKAVWATYRSALRNITKQSGFPYKVIWPTKP